MVISVWNPRVCQSGSLGFMQLQNPENRLQANDPPFGETVNGRKVSDKMTANTRDEELLSKLDALGIQHETVSHEPGFTVEESQALCSDLPGIHIKNLFLRDKKKNLFLVTVQEDTQVDLKALRKQIGASGNLSFGNADLLMEVLGVIPGAVTPLAVFNDADARVKVVLDKDIMAAELLQAHPLRNDRTTAIKPDDLLAFLAAQGYEPQIVDFASQALEGGTD